MSLAKLIRELPRLTAEERAAVRRRLRELDEQDTSLFRRETADTTFRELDSQERIERQVKKLSPAQQAALIDWLENLLKAGSR